MPSEARRPIGAGVAAAVGAALSTGELAAGEGASEARVGSVVAADGAGAGAQAAATTTTATSAATIDPRALDAEVAIMDTIRACVRGGSNPTSRSWPATWCGSLGSTICSGKRADGSHQIHRLDPTRAS